MDTTVAYGKITSSQQGVVDSDRNGFFANCGACRTRINAESHTPKRGNRTPSHHTLRQHAANSIRVNGWRYDKRLGWICPTCQDREDLEEIRTHGPKAEG